VLDAELQKMFLCADSLKENRLIVALMSYHQEDECIIDLSVNLSIVSHLSAGRFRLFNVTFVNW